MKISARQRFALLLAVALMAVGGGATHAWAAEADPPAFPMQPEPVDEGLFIDPAFLISTLVTDKGEIRHKTDPPSGTSSLDVHTGGFNWIFYPSIAVGWDWDGWQGSIRAAYNAQLIDLNLPHDLSAEGSLTSLEVGPELYVEVLEWQLTSLELGAGAGLRLAADADLDFIDQGAGRRVTRELHGASAIPGFTMHVGGGGELMRYSYVRLGWMLRFYYGQYDLINNERVDVATGFDQTEERLDLNVYSALIGLRLRIYPTPAKGNGR